MVYNMFINLRMKKKKEENKLDQDEKEWNKDEKYEEKKKNETY